MKGVHAKNVFFRNKKLETFLLFLFYFVNNNTIVYGFENDVAYNDFLYSNLLESLWEDTLALVYFTSSFWMTHPACYLDDAEYLTENKIKTLAVSFRDYITNSSRLESLLDWGIRPSGVAKEVLENSTVLSTEYGVNPTITTRSTSTNKLGLPTFNTVEKVRKNWQKLKEPVYLMILLDSSNDMTDEIAGKGETKWARAIKNLGHFAEVLEDNAIVNMTCFAENIVQCGSVSYPNGTLEESRDDIISFVSSDMVVSGDSTVALYKNLNETLQWIRQLKETNDDVSNFFNYVIVIISQDDTTKSRFISAEDLLDVVGINYTPDEVHIFPISFWGSSGGRTESTLKEIATRTNGNFYATTDDMEDIFEEISYYF